MVVRRLLAASLVLTVPAAALAQQQAPVPPEMAQAPRELLAQGGEPVDDTDLGEEESLKELIKEEIAPNEWSTPAAIGLSFIPGGGFGLIYAEKKAASAVPFLLSAAGYAVGALYMLGTFDTSKSTHCYYKNDPDAVTAGSKVSMFHCTYAKWDSRTTDDPIPGDKDKDGNAINTHSFDPNSGGTRAYIDSAANYNVLDSGENFDGTKTGIYIIAGTYVASTLLGAVWSGLTVSEHNEQLRKAAESTAMAPKPVMGFDGEKGYLGLVMDF